MNRSAIALHPEMIFARTSSGASEAVNSASHLASDLRFLLILVDGQSTLGQLQQRYDGDDIWTAASALWLGDYIRFVRDASATKATKAANTSQSANQTTAPQGTGLWDKLADTLSRTQPVPIYRPDSSTAALAAQTNATAAASAQSAIPAPHEVRFSASGKYWFSLGGQQLSATQISQLEEQQHGLAAMHAAMQGATKTLQPVAALSPEHAQPLPAVLPNAPGVDNKAKR